MRLKGYLDPDLPPPQYGGKALTNASYMESVIVVDCSNPSMAGAEETVFTSDGDVAYHYKWADPQYVELSLVGMPIEAGSVNDTARKIACDEKISTPLVTKKRLAAMDFKLLSSTADGNGDILYAAGQIVSSPDQREVILIINNHADHSIAEFLPSNVSLSNPPSYRMEVDRVLLKCSLRQMAIVKTEFRSVSGELVRLVFFPDHSFSEFQELSPFGVLQRIVCADQQQTSSGAQTAAGAIK